MPVTSAKAPTRSVYDKDKKRRAGQKTDVTGAVMTDEASCAAWLKRLQSRPADFPKARFVSQLESKTTMRGLLLLLACCCMSMPAPARTEGVIVRTTVKPEQGAVLGQHVSVFVDVLLPGEMPRPPQVALGEMPGAQIVRYETQATTMSDTIDGKTYSGQRFESPLCAARRPACDTRGDSDLVGQQR